MILIQIVLQKTIVVHDGFFMRCLWGNVRGENVRRETHK